MIVRMNGVMLDNPISVSMVGNEQPIVKLSDKIPIFLASVSSFLTALPAYAAGSNVSSAFEPIFHVLLDLAGPVCRIMFILGFVMVIIGRPRQGLDKMKWASIGYIGIQWTPMFMSIIKQAGAGM